MIDGTYAMISDVLLTGGVDAYELWLSFCRTLEAIRRLPEVG